jgi:hypothetical protein
VKWAPLAAMLIFLAAALLWLGRDGARSAKTYPPGSSLLAGPAGLSQLRGVLQERGVRTATLLRRPSELPHDAVLFRIEPVLRSTPRGLAADEDEFVRRGGHLILGIEGEVLEDAAAAVKVAPLLGDIDALAPPAPFALANDLLVDAQPVFEHGAFPSLAVRTLGQGEVWLLAEPALLHNENLDKAQNLALGVALAGNAREVFFDEAVHGDAGEGGTLELLRRWGLAPALLLGALALLAAFWREAATLGPPAGDCRETRAEAVDLVESMAALYDEVLSPADALGMYRARLVHEIGLRKAVGERSAEKLLQRYAPGFDGSADFRQQLLLLTNGFSRLRDEHRRS